MTDKTAGKTAGESGLFASLRALSSSLLAVIQTRLELLALDLAEERERLTALLGIALAALFFLGIGVILLVFLVIVAFWDTHRLLVTGGLTVLFLLTGGGLAALALHRLRNKPKLFSASLAELAKDRQQLNSGS